MRFHYDKKKDALYIRFSEKRYFKSDEVREDIIFDYDKKGGIIGIEVLDASQKFPKEFSNLFVKGNIPVVLNLRQRPTV